MTTAFVFAGGGSLGAIEVGMLHALVEHGASPDFVVGALAGAINAAYYAGRPDLEGVNRLAAIWRRLRGADVFPWSPFHGLLGFVGLRRSLVDPAPLRELLRRTAVSTRTWLKTGGLERTKIPHELVPHDHLTI